MYPPGLAAALRASGINAWTVVERSDSEVFAAAIEGDSVVLTENVGDFARIAADHLTAGGHHPGVLIALSSRFSRRPSGIPKLLEAVRTVMNEDLADRLIYMEQPWL